MTQNIIPLASPPIPRTHIATLLQTVFRIRDTRMPAPRKSIPFLYPDGRAGQAASRAPKQPARARQRKAIEKQAIPAFATEYDVEQTIVATEARCVLFLAADSDRRFPVRVTARSAAGVRVPWYEIETYHINVKRWVVRQTETQRERAFAVAEDMRLTNEPDDEYEVSGE